MRIVTLKNSARRLGGGPIGRIVRNAVINAWSNAALPVLRKMRGAYNSPLAATRNSMRASLNSVTPAASIERRIRSRIIAT